MYRRIETDVKWCPELPDTWRMGRVKHYFVISKENANQKDPVVLKLARSAVQVKDVSKNEGQMAESYENYNPVLKGDLLLNPMDLYSGANCNVSEVEGVISPAYINLRASQRLNPKYFDYYFKTQYWTMAMFAHGKGVSFDNRWTLNAEGLKNYEVPIPSIEEQDAIVEKLIIETKKVDALIENQEKQIENLKVYKKSIITEVVTRGLDTNAEMRSSGIDWLGEIPAHWTITKVRYIGSTQNGLSKGGEAFGEGYPFVSYGDVYRNYVLPETVIGLANTTEEERKNYSVEKGDIFFTRTSETIEEVGFSCVCRKTISDATFAGFVIRLRPYQVDEIILTEYAKYYFRGNHIRRYLVKEMNLVTRASLGQGLLKAMDVVLPTKEEQRQIANYLDVKCAHIDKLIEIKTSKIDKLNQYKKSLIYEYVTGKREVPSS